MAHVAGYSDSKDLAKVTISNKTLKDRAYEIAGKGYKKGLASMVYRFFDITTGSKASVNEEIAEELHKPMIKKFKKRSVCGRVKDNIWAADLLCVMFSPNIHGLNF